MWSFVGVQKILAWERRPCRRLWSFPRCFSKLCGRWFVQQHRFPVTVDTGICHVTFVFATLLLSVWNLRITFNFVCIFFSHCCMVCHKRYISAKCLFQLPQR